MAVTADMEIATESAFVSPPPAGTSRPAPAAPAPLLGDGQLEMLAYADRMAREMADALVEWARRRDRAAEEQLAMERLRERSAESIKARSKRRG